MTSIFSYPLNVIKQMVLGYFSTFNGESTAEYVRICSVGCDDEEDYNQMDDEENIICVVSKINAVHKEEEGVHPYVLSWDMTNCTFIGSMQLDQPASKHIDYDVSPLPVTEDFKDKNINLFEGHDNAYDLDCETEYPIEQYTISYPFNDAPFIKKKKFTTLRKLLQDVQKELQKAYAMDKLTPVHSLDDYIITTISINGAGVATIDIES